MMTEEDGATKHKPRMMVDASSSGGKGGGGNSHYQKKNKQRARGGGAGNRDAREPAGKETNNTGAPRRNGQCDKCKVFGHWARECKKFPREHTEIAHHANADIDAPPALLVDRKSHV